MKAKKDFGNFSLPAQRALSFVIHTDVVGLRTFFVYTVMSERVCDPPTAEKWNEKTTWAYVKS